MVRNTKTDQMDCIEQCGGVLATQIQRTTEICIGFCVNLLISVSCLGLRICLGVGLCERTVNGS